MMKFTPFARRHLSSAIGSLSKAEGVLLISASVKSHWFESSDSMVIVCSGAVCTSRLCGGELQAEGRGGDGTAGGM